MSGIRLFVSVRSSLTDKALSSLLEIFVFVGKKVITSSISPFWQVEMHNLLSSQIKNYSRLPGLFVFAATEGTLLFLFHLFRDTNKDKVLTVVQITTMFTSLSRKERRIRDPYQIIYLCNHFGWDFPLVLDKSYLHWMIEFGSVAGVRWALKFVSLKTKDLQGLPPLQFLLQLQAQCRRGFCKVDNLEAIFQMIIVDRKCLRFLDDNGTSPLQMAIDLSLLDLLSSLEY